MLYNMGTENSGQKLGRFPGEIANREETLKQTLSDLEGAVENSVY